VSKPELCRCPSPAHTAVGLIVYQRAVSVPITMGLVGEVIAELATHPAGITNKSLRALMAGLLGGANYSMNQASYDLARLRLNGLITRIPDRNRYRLTSDGLPFAIFYNEVHDRLLRPLLAAEGPPAPPPIRKALRTIDIHITQRIDSERLLPTAA
jgi:hypothetical protein